MTGIFDSGAGGLAALKELRRLSPREDIFFLADVKNAPYGTKTEDEIVALAEANIKKLRDAGAERVLIACCTASSFHGRMCREAREISTPIIEPTARQATRLTANGKIAVIATRLTAKSGAFAKAIAEMDIRAEVQENEAQALVEIAESVAHGGRLSCAMADKIRFALEPVKRFGADTLILGCTHFSHLKNEISEILEDIRIVDSARVGAECIARCSGHGLGETVFL